MVIEFYVERWVDGVIVMYTSWGCKHASKIEFIPDSGRPSLCIIVQVVIMGNR
jgi:hypothetical protein